MRRADARRSSRRRTRSCTAGTKTARKVCGDALPAASGRTARAPSSMPRAAAHTGEVAARADRRRARRRRVQAAADQDAPRQRPKSAARREMAMAESYATEDDLRRAFGERIAPAGRIAEGLRAGRRGPAPEPDQPAAAGRRKRTRRQAGAEDRSRHIQTISTSTLNCAQRAIWSRSSACRARALDEELACGAGRAIAR